jgi:hypothetical protein
MHVPRPGGRHKPFPDEGAYIAGDASPVELLEVAVVRLDEHEIYHPQVFALMLF